MVAATRKGGWRAKRGGGGRGGWGGSKDNLLSLESVYSLYSRRYCLGRRGDGCRREWSNKQPILVLGLRFSKANL